MSLTELDEKIIAEGKKLRAVAHTGALKARQSRLLAELEQIDADLKEAAAVLGTPASEKPAEKPAEVDKPAPAKSRKAPAKAAAAKADEADPTS